jgi:ABC-type dipeptide/oligopeptide/nickel transport system permease component
VFVYIVRRLGISVVLLAVAILATFLLHHALPGDPAAAVLGKQYTEEGAHEMRERLGLNDPLATQFGRYLGNVVSGDLGRSHVSNELVTDELKRVLPATVELGVCALFLATFVGITLGIVTAMRPRTWWDVGGLTLALAGVSLPIFWLGFLAIQFFGEGGTLAAATGMHGLPLGGRFSAAEIELGKYVAETPSATGFFLYDTLFVARDPGAFWHVVKHLLLPAVVLSSVPTAVIARITRASMGEALLQDYIRTARSKGLPQRVVVLKHALRNAAIPVTTSIGTQLGYLLGGAVLTETIFQWPGMGTYVVQSILNLDVKPLQACVLVVAIGFVFVNLLVDISYGFLDPRVSADGSRR